MYVVLRATICELLSPKSNKAHDVSSFIPCQLPRHLEARGTRKEHLTMNKRGKIVAKTRQALGKKRYEKIAAWNQAFQKARAELNITGFCPCGGKTAQGQALLARTRQILRASAVDSA